MIKLKFSPSHHGEISLISAIILTSALFGLYYLSPIGLAFAMAISFSLFISSAWTLIPHLVEHDQLGIAYGIVMSQKFFGCTVFTIAAGYMSYVDAAKSNPYENLLILLAVLALLSCLVMVYYCVRFGKKVAANKNKKLDASSCLKKRRGSGDTEEERKILR